MREYARVSPRFWIGETGRKIRQQGPAAQIVAMYLMTSPHSNMIGLYWLPIAYIAHETGVGLQGAEKALQSLIEVDFCAYDKHTEMVWVREMARFQIGDKLSPKDKQAKGVQNAYDDVPANPFLEEFFATHSEALCMERARVYEGPSEVLASKAQAQAKAKEQAKAQAQAAAVEDPVEFEIPLIGSDSHAVTRSRLDFWKSLYPAVDVRQEVRKMIGWVDADKTRRKTKSGVEKFITSWLSRAQDQGGSPARLGSQNVTALPTARAGAAERRAAFDGGLDDILNDLQNPNGGTDAADTIDVEARRVG